MAVESIWLWAKGASAQPMSPTSQETGASKRESAFFVEFNTSDFKSLQWPRLFWPLTPRGVTDVSSHVTQTFLGM